MKDNNLSSTWLSVNQKADEVLGINLWEEANLSQLIALRICQLQDSLLQTCQTNSTQRSSLRKEFPEFPVDFITALTEIYGIGRIGEFQARTIFDAWSIENMSRVIRLVTWELPVNFFPVFRTREKIELAATISSSLSSAFLRSLENENHKFERGRSCPLQPLLIQIDLKFLGVKNWRSCATILGTPRRVLSRRIIFVPMPSDLNENCWKGEAWWNHWVFE